MSTVPHWNWGALIQHSPGSVPPQASVDAHQGRRAARPRAGVDVRLGEGAVRCRGAVCAPQVISVKSPGEAVGVLRERAAAVPRSAVGDVAAARVAIAATPASARAVGYVAPPATAPNVARFSARAAALQAAHSA